MIPSSLLPLMLIALAVSSIIGYKVISAVPSLLHTPLMSGMNALSGITVLGSLAVFVTASSAVKPLAAVAVVMAMINVVGGFWVTERMLRMFQQKGKGGEMKAGKKIPWS